ncbi:hypothetical protein PF008_g12934 [Phytophthora fragariae]|uniref:Uncharacterized protein n=1 Tax=Phytophthora fragariae TaxID=53985 RepID=A0A6G0RLJ7_9STRA|nr:hypothetical protein PF008_g12934 [Phytophthora fragariae]
MSPMDQVDRFCDGLKSESRKEMVYLRCSTLAEAIAATQAFERTYFQSSTDRGRSGYASQRGPAHRAANDDATPMDIPAVDTRSISKEQFRRQNLCFYCKRDDHRISNSEFWTSGKRASSADADLSGVSIERTISSQPPTVQMDTTILELSTSEMTGTPRNALSVSLCCRK